MSTKPRDHLDAEGEQIARITGVNPYTDFWERLDDLADPDPEPASAPQGAAPAQPAESFNLIEAAIRTAFTAKYGEVDDARLVTAASELMMEGRRYRPNEIGKFIDDIAAKVGARARAQLADATASNDDDDDDDDGRTTGIFGGSESGGKPTRGGPVQENPNEMLDDLKEFQKKLGIY